MKMLPRFTRAAIATGLALLVASSDAAAGPMINPGQWHYAAQLTYKSGMLGGHSMHKEWNVCVSPAQAEHPTPLPQVPGVQCDKPTLTTVGKAIHTSMTCTTQTPQGIASSLHDDFTITPSDNRNKVTIDGTVHQSFTSPVVHIPDADLAVQTTGVRTGDCTAAAGAASTAAH